MSLKIKMETFMSPEINRRVFLKAASAGIVTLVNFKSWTSITRGQAVHEKDVIEIKIYQNDFIGRWYFEPVGLYIRPGQKVRWICEMWGSSATAFHPVNENHELRIPKKAKPFDSGILFDRGIPGSTFDYVDRRLFRSPGSSTRSTGGRGSVVSISSNCDADFEE